MKDGEKYKSLVEKKSSFNGEEREIEKKKLRMDVIKITVKVDIIGSVPRLGIAQCLLMVSRVPRCPTRP